MRKITHLLGALAISASFMRSIAAQADNGLIERGRYLVALGGCAHVTRPATCSASPTSPAILAARTPALMWPASGPGATRRPGLTERNRR